MCVAPKMPKPQPVALPEPVKPIEQSAIPVAPAAPPPPEKTATYLGRASGAPKVTASPTPTRGFSSLRIRPRAPGQTGLNVPNA